MAVRRAVFAGLALGVALAPLLTLGPRAQASPSIESQVFSMINGGRAGGFVVHSGLLAVARGHSQGMASRGGLDHDNADGRISNAPPDPFETNGAPDDGWPVASWCENVTYAMAVPESEVAGRLYGQWARSAPHQRCMTQTHRNVGAVGIYYDGQTWWATFIAQVDNTPPGQAPPDSTADDKKPPAPKVEADTAPEPVAPAEPRTEPAVVGEVTEHGDDPVETVTEVEPEPTAEPEPVDDPISIYVERSGEAAKPPVLRTITEPLGRVRNAVGAAYGWREVAAVAALLLLASWLLRRSGGKPAAEVEGRHDEPLPEVEAVGSGPVGVGIEGDGLAPGLLGDTHDVIDERLPVPAGSISGLRDEVIHVQNTPVDEIRHHAVARDGAAFVLVD